MVKLCNHDTYITPHDSIQCDKYFNEYPFELSPFQKYAIEAIVQKQHVLVTAHTGSGKTLPAEFAIQHMVSQGKKVIYASPIKALHNQKYREFCDKFPNISFGLITGDIKTNPSADVLVMTTEILWHNLSHRMGYADSNAQHVAVGRNHFDMDIENELGCVVFDEVHYINDKERGHIWEWSIMSLPNHVQLVMLSATIDSPEEFAEWCESVSNKTVYIASTTKRPVPLTHYAFLTGTMSAIKSIPKTDQDYLQTHMNKLVRLQNSDNTFNSDGFVAMSKHMSTLSYHHIYSNNMHVLNNVGDYLATHKMTPAICFVFSKKMVEKYAKSLTVSLIRDDDDDVFNPEIVKHECSRIIRKLPNPDEYFRLPEYNSLVSLLQKGIAIHHAGMLPVFREMVELVFTKGFIKILFATETFAVGINMPTKTVIFTHVNKHDGVHRRYLLPHEYTQMAGRAGRRGIDTIGTVIYLPNIAQEWDSLTLKRIMCATPQKIVSKTKIDPNTILTQLHNSQQPQSHNDISTSIEKSMLNFELLKRVKQAKQTLSECISAQSNCENIVARNTVPINDIRNYIAQVYVRNTNTNKKRKQAAKQVCALEATHPSIIQESKYVTECDKCAANTNTAQTELHHATHIIRNGVLNTVHELIAHGYVQLASYYDGCCCDDDTFSLTQKGRIAAMIHETPSLIMADMIVSGHFANRTAIDLLHVFSLFTNVKWPDESYVCFDQTGIKDDNTHNDANSVLLSIYTYQNKWITCTDTPVKYSTRGPQYIDMWANCTSEEECKQVIQDVWEFESVFMGDFIKSVLKVVNIAHELEPVCELTCDMDMLNELKRIPELMLKHVATHTSLYV